MTNRQFVKNALTRLKERWAKEPPVMEVSLVGGSGSKEVVGRFQLGEDLRAPGAVKKALVYLGFNEAPPPSDI